MHVVAFIQDPHRQSARDIDVADRGAYEYGAGVPADRVETGAAGPPHGGERMSMRTSLTVIAFASLLASGHTRADPEYRQHLTSGPNAIEGGFYGYGGVAVDATRILVAEPGGLSGGSPSVHSGAAEVWRADGTTLVREQRLVPAAPESGANFGFRVAIDGDWLALFDRTGGIPRIRLYRHDAGGWTAAQTIDSTNGDTTGFGASIMLMGDLLAIGSAGYVPPSSSLANSGAVLLYRLDAGTWQSPQTIEGLDPAAQRQFGASLALSARLDGARMLAVGAPGRSSQAGAVYLFREEGGTWIQEQRVSMTAPEAGEQLGASVALRGATLLAGASGATVAGQAQAGRAGLWRRSGSGDFPWVAEAVVNDPDMAAGDRFGVTVGLPREDEAVIGAPFRDTMVIGTVSNAGAAWLYRRTRLPPACTPSWTAAGGVGNPTALPQADALYGAAIGAGARWSAIAAIAATVQGTADAGAVDAFIEERLFDDAFDCPP